MLTQERSTYILEKIKNGGAAHVETLAKEAGVSPMTIRRDLTKLAKEGLIERCHGGALLKRETPYREKKTSNADEKIKIAQTAVNLIPEKASVFLDAGTSTWHIAFLLTGRKDLTVITADLEIAHLLKDSQVKLIVCGGEVQKKTGSMLGFFANRMIAEMRFEQCFIGTACIDENFDILTPTTEKAELKRLIVKNSRASYLVADSSKFYKQAMTRINSLSDYTGLITTKKFSREEKENLTKKSVTIIDANTE